MSEAMKPTKGEAFNQRGGFSTVYVEVRIGGGMLQEVAACGPTQNGPDEQQSNADLIAEAFNTHNITGLSPRQLAEQRDELLEAIKTGHSDFSGMPCGDLLAAANVLRNYGADDLARRLEDKHELECAAIAKCEVKP